MLSYNMIIFTTTKYDPIQQWNAGLLFIGIVVLITVVNILFVIHSVFQPKWSKKKKVFELKSKLSK